MFRTAALILAVFLFLPLQARADPGEPIRSTIDRQIAAFQADDVETAFSFAAPNIKALFGTAERFGRMVREGYPMVWRPVTVAYLDLELTDEGWIQRVLFEDAMGRYFVGAYFMVETADGWQIRAVTIERSPQASA